MIPDLGRRYFLFVGTPRGKRIVVALLICIAVVMDWTATSLVSSGHNSRFVVALFSLAAGLLIACVFLLLMNRRSA
jgi:hypothetical protein